MLNAMIQTFMQCVYNLYKCLFSKGTLQIGIENPRSKCMQKYAQNNAKVCKFMQNYAKVCKFVQQYVKQTIISKLDRP